MKERRKEFFLEWLILKFSFALETKMFAVLAPIEYTAQGKKHTVICEGEWVDDTETGEQQVRLDCAQFPEFWLTGTLKGGAFRVTGGRLARDWGSDLKFVESVPHTRFLTKMDEHTINVYHQSITVFIPLPGVSEVVGAYGADCETVTLPSGLLLTRKR